MGFSLPVVGDSALGVWILMTVVMMGPAALPGISHIRRNSLSWRRRRAAIEYAGGYLGVWTLVGAVTLLVLWWADVTPSGAALTIALGAAAIWQLTPMKWTCLRACHRSVPLPPRGWAAERAAIHFGTLNGSACVGSCWWLMLAMAVSPGLHLELMAVTTAAVTAERMGYRPRRVVRWTAVALAGAAMLIGVDAWAVAAQA